VKMREHTGMGYALEPSVRHSLNEGLATVALTGRFLRNMTNTGFFWIPGVKYERSGAKGDIDLLACCDGFLVFGECKKLTSTPHDAATWSATADQFLKLATVAIECQGSLAVLAALVDAFPEEIHHRIEKELSGKIPFLLLNKADLNKGHRSSEPGKEWPPLDLRKLVLTKFPESQVARTPGQRQIKLGWSVYKKATSEKPKTEEG